MKMKIYIKDTIPIKDDYCHTFELNIDYIELTPNDKNKLIEILENINKEFSNKDISKYIDLHKKTKIKKSNLIENGLFDFETNNNFDEAIVKLNTNNSENTKENLANIETNFNQGDVNEYANKYGRSDESIKPSNETKSAGILRQTSIKFNELSAGQINSDEYENNRIHSAQRIQQDKITISREEIGLDTSKTNCIQDERNDSQRADENSQTNNEQFGEEKRAFSETKRNFRQNRDINTARQSIKDIVTQKEIDELLTIFSDCENEIDKIDKSLNLDINSKEFLSNLQNACFELAVMLMDGKTRRGFFESVHRPKEYSEKFYEINLNYKASKINYDFLKLNEKEKEYFTYFFNLAIAQEKASKIDLSTSIMVSSILHKQAKNLSILNEDIEKSANNLEILINQFQKSNKTNKKIRHH